jgi:hypothetical protein
VESVYEAVNGVEAHMIADLLAQQDITSRVDGTFLQGAVGGLPASGLVRVMVEPEDHGAARAIIDEWNTRQVDPTPEPPAPTKPKARWPVFVAGLLVGVGASFAYVRTPVKTQGVDYDNNGVLDETFTYSARNLPLKWEADRNLDGKVDAVVFYDDLGLPYEGKSDDNFDGVFDTHSHMRAGNVVVTESDTNGDGFVDMRSHFVSGVGDRTEYLEPRTGRVLKVDYFKMGKIVRAEIDDNGDGMMDRRVTYDAIGEVVGTEKIQR